MKHIESLLNPAVIYYLLKNYNRIALIVPDNKIVDKVSEEIELLSKLINKKFYPVKIYENNLIDEQFFDFEKYQEESASLYQFSNKGRIPIISAEAILRKTFLPDAINSQNIRVGESLDIAKLEKDLINMGYRYEVPVEEKGTYQVKGGIIDLFIPLYDNPIRVELFGDEIESIRFFDANYQTSLDEIKEFELIQSINFDFSEKNLNNFNSYMDNLYREEKISFDAKEVLKETAEKKIFDLSLIKYAPFFYDTTTYLSILKKKKKKIFIYDPASVEKKIDFLKSSGDFDLYYINKSFRGIATISPIIEDDNKVILDSDIKNPYRIILQEPKTFFRLSYLIEEILKENKTVNIFYTVAEKRKDIIEILNRFNIVHDSIIWHKGLLKNGFQTEEGIFISDYLILGEYTPQHLKRSAKNIISSFSDLNKGDYIVHSNYGIGKYQGLITREIGGNPTDFLEIHYAKSDKLFVPVYNISMLYKHSSSEATVKLDSFRSKAWENRKSKIKKSIEVVAKDLIKLYANRIETKGISFSENDELYDAFCKDFPFILTDDQQTTINEVNIDMEAIKPMDRLVCGDVGFGKTEVAMRAAFKAVVDNYQVALLAPTTVLSFQHYLSFIDRFKNFPINIEYISSFKSAKEKRDIFERLRLHKIDILIGTQSLLAKKTEFKNLGLLIIDEEQKFGVKDKERLRDLKANLDTMTMTATPIPRTLNFSLSGIRDLSIIKTAPKNRKAVKTVVIRKFGKKIKSALEYELKRNGQIFYIHNRIGTIYKEADYILSLVPNIKMAIAHSDIPKKKLEKIMIDFYKGKFDLLLSTNIIESGIDIPNANTMIIDRADTFGLSSLYQLRGRVGRSEVQGYTILVTPSNAKLSNIAQRRLSIISRYTDLGSGFQIAMQDLEIRGAGSLLGYVQKGHFNSIGYEAYMNFLKDAIAELKGEKRVGDFKVELNTTFVSLIPATFIKDEFTRLSFYKRISNAISNKELNDIAKELKDRFGKLPEEVNNFIKLIKIKAKAITYKISKVTLSDGFLYLKLSDPDLINLVSLMPYLVKHREVNISPTNEISIKGEFSSIDDLLKTFELLVEAVF